MTQIQSTTIFVFCNSNAIMFFLSHEEGAIIPSFNDVVYNKLTQWVRLASENKFELASLGCSDWLSYFF